MAGRDAMGRAMSVVYPHLQWVRRVPILGNAARRASRAVVPVGTLVPVTIERGIAAGLQIRVDPRAAKPFVDGTVEPAVASTLTDILRPGDTFFDVGANVGYFTLAAARIVGSTGQVVAFEADPSNAEELRHNASTNGFDNITVHEAAVWSESGEVTFTRADPTVTPGRGLGGVAATNPVDVQGVEVSVPAVTLDEIFDPQSPPDVVKMDIEGAEVKAFEGARALLTSRPKIICEMHSEENARTLTALFEREGYTCEEVDYMHVLAVAR